MDKVVELYFWLDQDTSQVSKIGDTLGALWIDSTTYIIRIKIFNNFKW